MSQTLWIIGLSDLLNNSCMLDQMITALLERRLVEALGDEFNVHPPHIEKLLSFSEGLTSWLTYPREERASNKATYNLNDDDGTSIDCEACLDPPIVYRRVSLPPWAALQPDRGNMYRWGATYKVIVLYVMIYVIYDDAYNYNLMI